MLFHGNLLENGKRIMRATVALAEPHAAHWQSVSPAPRRETIRQQSYSPIGRRLNAVKADFRARPVVRAVRIARRRERLHTRRKTRLASRRASPKASISASV